jgi:hypothetical protein
VPSLDLFIDLLGRFSKTHGELAIGQSEALEACLGGLLLIYTHRHVQGDSTRLLHDFDRATAIRRALVYELAPAVSTDSMILKSAFSYYFYEGTTKSWMVGLIDFSAPDVSPACLECISNILVQHVWVRMHRDMENSRPEDLFRFVKFCLSRKPALPRHVATNCIIIIGLTLGIEFHVQDLSVGDKRSVAVLPTPNFHLIVSVARDLKQSSSLSWIASTWRFKIIFSRLVLFCPKLLMLCGCSHLTNRRVRY